MFAEMTIGEIASRLPASMPVFEKFHIDYCCAGTKSFSRACRECGAKPEEVVTEIQQAQASGLVEESVDWTTVPVADLINHIIRHHHWYTWAELPRLEQQLGKLLQSFHPEYPNSLLLLSGVFRGLRQELEDHMMKEQTQVFPLMTALEASSRTVSQENRSLLRSAIAGLVHEHELSWQALKEMQEITRAVAGDIGKSRDGGLLLEALQEFERDLHVHIHLENNILFPRVHKQMQTC